MAVLKHTSPDATPTAPKPLPVSPVPSASARQAVGSDSVHPGSLMLSSSPSGAALALLCGADASPYGGSVGAPVTYGRPDAPSTTAMACIDGAHRVGRSPGRILENRVLV